MIFLFFFSRASKSDYDLDSTSDRVDEMASRACYTRGKQDTEPTAWTWVFLWCTMYDTWQTVFS